MRRKWITLLRIFRYGLNNFSRNTWLTTAATAVMTVTLLIIMGTFVARMVFADTINEFRQKLDVSVYLKDEIPEKELQRFTNELKQVPVVTGVEHITKDQARSSFQQKSSKDLQQLEALGEIDTNPFPASLRIKTKDPNKLQDLNNVINSQKNKELLDPSTPTSYSGERKEAIDRIAQISEFSERAGLVAATIFVIISVLIIFNTIRMAIFNRKDEIEIMKLIGAEKRFIRGPFIVEASLYGILAAAFSILLIYTILLTWVPNFADYEIKVAGTVEFFKTWPLLIILAQMLIGIAIGVISSLLAMRRYLKL